MKSKLFTLIAVAAATCASQASITLTGLAVGTAYPATPASAQLGLILIKGTTGWLNDTLTSGQNGLTSASNPVINSSAAGLTVGSTFGGNLVAGLLTSSGTFMNGANSSILAANAGKEFAILWFSNLPAAGAPATAPAGSTYGIARDSTWTMGADGTSFGFATTVSGSNPFSRITDNQTGNSTSGFGTVQFATQGAAFSIAGAVPEPSAALLGAVGALGLLRRRRI